MGSGTVGFTPEAFDRINRIFSTALARLHGLEILLILLILSRNPVSEPRRDTFAPALSKPPERYVLSLLRGGGRNRVDDARNPRRVGPERSVAPDQGDGTVSHASHPGTAASANPRARRVVDG